MRDFGRSRATVSSLSTGVAQSAVALIVLFLAAALLPLGQCVRSAGLLFAQGGSWRTRSRSRACKTGLT
jgi:hypothetical protein